MCILPLWSCQNNYRPGVKEILKNLIGYTITFPSDLISKVYLAESADKSLHRKPYKMVVYLNANGCESCKIQTLMLVDQFIVENKFSGKLEAIIIINTLHIESTDRLLRELCVVQTVFYDLDGSFERLNPHLPDDDRFHTLLLGEDNKIIVVGSPLNNSKLKNLYFAALN